MLYGQLDRMTGCLSIVVGNHSRYSGRVWFAKVCKGLGWMEARRVWTRLLRLFPPTLLVPSGNERGTIHDRKQPKEKGPQHIR